MIPAKLAISKTHIFVLGEDGTIIAAKRDADPVVFFKLPLQESIHATHIATDRMCNLYLCSDAKTYYKIWFRIWGPCDLLYRRLDTNMPNHVCGTGRVFVSDSIFGLEGPTCEWASVRYLSMVRTGQTIDKAFADFKDHVFDDVPEVEYVTAMAYNYCRMRAQEDPRWTDENRPSLVSLTNRMVYGYIRNNSMYPTVSQYIELEAEKYGALTFEFQREYKTYLGLEGIGNPDPGTEFDPDADPKADEDAVDADPEAYADIVFDPDASRGTVFDPDADAEAVDDSGRFTLLDEINRSLSIESANELLDASQAGGGAAAAKTDPSSIKLEPILQLPRGSGAIKKGRDQLSASVQDALAVTTHGTDSYSNPKVQKIITNIQKEMKDMYDKHVYRSLPENLDDPDIIFVVKPDLDSGEFIEMEMLSLKKSKVDVKLAVYKFGCEIPRVDAEPGTEEPTTSKFPICILSGIENLLHEGQHIGNTQSPELEELKRRVKWTQTEHEYKLLCLHVSELKVIEGIVRKRIKHRSHSVHVYLHKTGLVYVFDRNGDTYQHKWLYRAIRHLLFNLSVYDGTYNVENFGFVGEEDTDTPAFMGYHPLFQERIIELDEPDYFSAQHATPIKFTRKKYKAKKSQELNASHIREARQARRYSEPTVPTVGSVGSVGSVLPVPSRRHSASTLVPERSSYSSLQF